MQRYHERPGRLASVSRVPRWPRRRVRVGLAAHPDPLVEMEVQRWPPLLLAHALEEGILSLADLLRRKILIVGGNRPVVAEGIDEPPVAVAPEHVLRRHGAGGTGLDGPLEGRVAIVDVEHQAAGGSVERRR